MRRTQTRTGGERRPTGQPDGLFELCLFALLFLLPPPPPPRSLFSCQSLQTRAPSLGRQRRLLLPPPHQSLGLRVRLCARACLCMSALPFLHLSFACPRPAQLLFTFFLHSALRSSHCSAKLARRAQLTPRASCAPMHCSNLYSACALWQPPAFQADSLPTVFANHSPLRRLESSPFLILHTCARCSLSSAANKLASRPTKFLTFTHSRVYIYLYMNKHLLVHSLACLLSCLQMFVRPANWPPLSPCVRAGFGQPSRGTLLHLSSY